MPAPERRRVALCDYNDLSHRAELGLGDGYTLPLGIEDVFPDLATLRDGEPIIAADGMELWSEATARLVEGHGRRYWYATIICAVPMAHSWGTLDLADMGYPEARQFRPRA